MAEPIIAAQVQTMTMKRHIFVNVANLVKMCTHFAP